MRSARCAQYLAPAFRVFHQTLRMLPELQSQVSQAQGLLTLLATEQSSGPRGLSRTILHRQHRVRAPWPPTHLLRRMLEPLPLEESGGTLNCREGGMGH